MGVCGSCRQNRRKQKNEPENNEPRKDGKDEVITGSKPIPLKLHMK